MWGVLTVWQALNHVGSTKPCGGAQNHVGSTDHVASEQIQAFPVLFGREKLLSLPREGKGLPGPVGQDSWPCLERTLPSFLVFLPLDLGPLNFDHQEALTKTPSSTSCSLGLALLALPLLAFHVVTHPTGGPAVP